MARKKQQRIREAQVVACVIDSASQNPAIELAIWRNPTKKLTLEIGCGRGEYTIALAQQYPKQQFIGVDYQGERLWYAAQQIQALQLTNVRLLRGQAKALNNYITPKSVETIWITFPDPYPKKKRAHNRLTHPKFLESYKKLLTRNGALNLKTDNQALYEYSLETLINHGWKIIKKSSQANDDIQTYYEKLYREQGKAIYYLQAIPVSS